MKQAHICIHYSSNRNSYNRNLRTKKLTIFLLKSTLFNSDSESFPFFIIFIIEISLMTHTIVTVRE